MPSGIDSQVDAFCQESGVVDVFQEDVGGVLCGIPAHLGCLIGHIRAFDVRGHDRTAVQFAGKDGLNDKRPAFRFDLGVRCPAKPFIVGFRTLFHGEHQVTTHRILVVDEGIGEINRRQVGAVKDMDGRFVFLDGLPGLPCRDVHDIRLRILLEGDGVEILLYGHLVDGLL